MKPRLWVIICCMLLVGSVGPSASARAVEPVFAAAGGADDWPQFRQGPEHTGYNPAETTISPGNVAGLGLAWQGPTGSYIASSPAVADGVVYVGSEDGNLYAFAVGCSTGGGTCTPLWTGTTGAWITSSPAVADGVVYVGSWDRHVYAFGVGCRSDGGLCMPLWTGTTGGAIASSPAVAEGVVYIGSDDGTLYAFAVGCSVNGGTCTPVWTGRTAAWIESSPAIADGVVYIGSGDGTLHAFGVGCSSSGGLCPPLWTAEVEASVSSPVVADGVVYAGSWQGNLTAVKVGCSPVDGMCTPLWRSAAGMSSTSSPTVSDGVVYAGSSDGRLYAFDLEHGDITPPVVTSAPRVEGAVPSTLGRGSTLISWKGSDGNGSGIVHYDLQSQRNGGPWITVPSSDATEVTRSLKLGHSYRYRVRAHDRAGNVGAWVVGSAVVPGLIQGSSARVRYPVGTWHTQVIAKASGGSTRWSSSTHARATFRFTGRAVAWVTSTGSHHGSVDVYIDGVFRAKVDLHHDFKQWMRVLFSTSWSKRGTHTIQLRSSSPGIRIDVDAFVVYR